LDCKTGEIKRWKILANRDIHWIITSYFLHSPCSFWEIIIYIYKNRRTDVCLLICMSVGMWKANWNPNPCMDLDKTLHSHLHLSKEGFGTVLTLAPSPPRGLKLLKLKGTFSKTAYKTKNGCKLTRAALGTSASILYLFDCNLVLNHVSYTYSII